MTAVRKRIGPPSSARRLAGAGLFPVDANETPRRGELRRGALFLLWEKPRPPAVAPVGGPGAARPAPPARGPGRRGARCLLRKPASPPPPPPGGGGGWFFPGCQKGPPRGAAVWGGSFSATGKTPPPQKPAS